MSEENNVNELNESQLEHKDQKSEFIDQAEKKITDFANDAKGKIDEMLHSDAANEIKNKAENFVNDAKSKLDDVVNGDTAQNIKEKATEYAEQAGDVLEDLTDKVEEYSNLAGEKLNDLVNDSPKEVQEVVKKGKNFLQRLFGK